MGKKKRKRMSKSAAVYIPIAVLLILLFGILGTSVFLKIIEIEVTGATKYPNDAIIMSSGIAIGDNILRIDKDKASQMIEASMPYISGVEIEFVLPDKARISISEASAFAAVSVSDGFIVISSTGRILEIVDSAPVGLVEVRGFAPVDVKIGGALKAASGDDTRLRYIKEVLAAIESAGIQDGVSFLDVTSMGNIYLEYLGLYRVNLNGSGGAISKLAKLPEAIEDVKKDSSFDVTARYRIDIPDSSGGWIWTPEW